MASFTASALALLACAMASLSFTGAHADPIFRLNPLAYHRPNEAAGSATATNAGSSGPTYNGGANDVTFGVPGPHGLPSVAFFNGTTGSIAIPDGAGALQVQSFTLEAFADPTANPALFTIYGQKRAAGGTGIALSLQNDHPTLLLNKGVTNADLVATGVTVPLDRYSFLAATYDNATGVADLYLNGALAAEDNVGTLNLSFQRRLRPVQRPGVSRQAAVRGQLS